MVKIGMVNYINTAPIYEVWKEQQLPEDWQVIEAHPAVLNTMLSEGNIDLGFVSSQAYSIHPEQYSAFADLSISATGPVGSVFLFSMLPPEQLDGKLIILSDQSDTSIALARVLLEEFVQVQPRYQVGNPLHLGTQEAEVAAVVSIGNDALRLREQERYPYALDLAQEWQQYTGLPFVFSVWAVRDDFLQRDEHTARAIHRQLLACREEGRKRMTEICQRVAHRIPMECSACSQYLHGIEHDLSPLKIQGLEYFFQFLIQRKEASPNAVPIKIFS